MLQMRIQALVVIAGKTAKTFMQDMVSIAGEALPGRLL